MRRVALPIRAGRQVLVVLCGLETAEGVDSETRGVSITAGHRKQSSEANSSFVLIKLTFINFDPIIGILTYQRVAGLVFQCDLQQKLVVIAASLLPKQ